MTDARDTDRPADRPPTPAWVKVVGAIVGVLLLLFLVLLLTGGPGRHGPGRHGAATLTRTVVLVATG